MLPLNREEPGNEARPSPPTTTCIVSHWRLSKTVGVNKLHEVVITDVIQFAKA